MKEIAICPICGNDNKCAVAKNEPESECWCVGKASLPREILTRYEWRPCICESCYDKIILEKKDKQ